MTPSRSPIPSLACARTWAEPVTRSALHLRQTAHARPSPRSAAKPSADHAAVTIPHSRIPNPSSQGIVNAIGVDFIAAEIDGNGSTLAIVITSSIETTSQVMLSSLTHR